MYFPSVTRFASFEARTPWSYLIKERLLHSPKVPFDKDAEGTLLDHCINS